MASAANRKDMQFQEFNASASAEHRTQYFRIVGANHSNDRRKCVKLLHTQVGSERSEIQRICGQSGYVTCIAARAHTHPSSFGNNFHCMRKIDRSSLEFSASRQ